MNRNRGECSSISPLYYHNTKRDQELHELNIIYVTIMICLSQNAHVKVVYILIPQEKSAKRNWLAIRTHKNNEKLIDKLFEASKKWMT